ncbi:hypothetical protein IEO21_06063 [Rhodonia placenta]|uniref:Uncharacterized protein n=1 Tax=Rhodonia placenta TaxID=104341 RepID=A0A8H7P101_9APHY|nr:hypothetical protein IEO21_06063 [Postia placenta]
MEKRLDNRYHSVPCQPISCTGILSLSSYLSYFS